MNLTKSRSLHRTQHIWIARSLGVCTPHNLQSALHNLARVTTRVRVWVRVRVRFTVKPFNLAALKIWRLSMQNYFGRFYFGELKPYNSKYWPAVDIRAL